MARPQLADHRRKSGVVGADNPFILSFPGQHDARQPEGMLEIVRSKDARMCREGIEPAYFAYPFGQDKEVGALAPAVKPVPAVPDFRDERGPVKLSQQGVRNGMSTERRQPRSGHFADHIAIQSLIENVGTRQSRVILRDEGISGRNDITLI